MYQLYAEWPAKVRGKDSEESDHATYYEALLRLEAIRKNHPQVVGTIIKVEDGKQIHDA